MAVSGGDRRVRFFNVRESGTVIRVKAYNRLTAIQILHCLQSIYPLSHSPDPPSILLAHRSF